MACGTESGNQELAYKTASITSNYGDRDSVKNISRSSHVQNQCMLKKS